MQLAEYILSKHIFYQNMACFTENLRYPKGLILRDKFVTVLLQLALTYIKFRNLGAALIRERR